MIADMCTDDSVFFQQGMSKWIEYPVIGMLRFKIQVNLSKTD